MALPNLRGRRFSIAGAAPVPRTPISMASRFSAASNAASPARNSKAAASSPSWAAFKLICAKRTWRVIRPPSKPCPSWVAAKSKFPTTGWFPWRASACSARSWTKPISTRPASPAPEAVDHERRQPVRWHRRQELARDHASHTQPNPPRRNLPPRLDSHRRAAGLSTHRLPRNRRPRSNRPLGAALPAVCFSLPHFVVFLPRQSAGKIWPRALDRYASHRCAGRRRYLGRRGRELGQHTLQDAIFSGPEPPLPAGSSPGILHRPAALSPLGHLVLRDH